MLKDLFTQLMHYRTPTIILLLGLLLTAGLVTFEYQNLQVQRANSADTTLQKYASALQSSLDQRLFTLDSLDAFMHSYSELDLSIPAEEKQFKLHFDKFGQKLHQSVDGMLSLQLAPQGIIRYLTGGESNKKALGYDLFEDDTRKQQIIRAVYQYKQVITGPIQLIQGGEAIIARKALFSDDSPNASANRLREKLLFIDASDLPENFWGLATVLFTTEALLNRAGLSNTRQKGFDFALKGRHGLGASGEVFWGDAALFDVNTHVTAIRFDAGEWLLATRHNTPFPLTGLISLAVLGILLTVLSVYAEIVVTRNRRVAESERAKEAFLASMSHEIRSPLNGVVGLTSLLRKTPLSDEQTRLVGGIESSASQLSAVIGDILDFSKISAGKIELEYGAAKLQTLLEQCLDIVMPLAEKKAHKLSYEMPGSLRDIAFKTDETRFKQIIINLLSNAIKFTDNGGEIKLLAEIRQIGEDALLTVTVRDNGIGMSESEIARLFQRFTQADASTTRKYGGTGLGLAISRNLARLMGGDLSVFSVKHQGSDFTLQLPFEQLTMQVHDSDSVLPALSLDENLRILVVDDLPMNLTMMVMMLKKLGFEADTANNGLEAVKRQASEPYDLIFMDWEMPELDGVEATRRIRNLNGADNKPWIIALTANASTTHKEACIKAGMNDYLAKPVSIDQIANKLKQVSA